MPWMAMIITTWDPLHRFFTSSKRIWSTVIVPDSVRTWLLLIILGVRLFTSAQLSSKTVAFKAQYHRVDYLAVQWSVTEVNLSTIVCCVAWSFLCHRHSLDTSCRLCLQKLAVLSWSAHIFYLICFSFYNDFSSHWSTVNIIQQS